MDGPPDRVLVKRGELRIERRKALSMRHQAPAGADGPMARSRKESGDFLNRARMVLRSIRIRTRFSWRVPRSARIRPTSPRTVSSSLSETARAASRGCGSGMSVFELPVKLVQEIGVNTPQVRLSLRLHHAWGQELFFAMGAPDISTCINGPYPQGGRTARTNHRHTINLGTDRVRDQDGGRGFVETRGRWKIRREGLDLVIAVLAADVAAAPGILDAEADLAVGTDRDKLRQRLAYGFSSPEQASRGS